jgi:hypothetical protein
MLIEAKDDDEEDETGGALCDAAPNLGSCSLSEAAPSLGSTFQPEDVESEEEEEEVPGTPGQTQIPFPPLRGAQGETQLLEPRRSPRKKQATLPS